MSVLMMRLADRLVLVVLLTRAATALFACSAIFAAVELVDLANFVESPALLRYPLRLPLVLVLVSPVAALIAAGWTTSHFVRTEQLTALSAAGIGPRRALAIVVLVGVGWASCSWVLAEFLAPVGLHNWSRDRVSSPRSRWVRTGDHLYRFDVTEGGEARGILMFVLDDAGVPSRRIEAARAVRSDGGWELRDVTVTSSGADPVKQERMGSPVRLRFAGIAGSPSELTGPALAAAARAARETGGDDAPLTAERGLRGALALACLICTIFGIVIGVRTGRRPELTTALTAAVGLGYWLFISSCWTLATVGAFPAWTVVAVPTVGLGAIAGVLWARL